MNILLKVDVALRAGMRATFVRLLASAAQLHLSRSSWRRWCLLLASALNDSARGNLTLLETDAR